ncbi:MAG: phosphatidate cytidylyltransferase, partial [Candidatus Krumholzibacteria bacterium]|nr:phosphatidate cytidylyltransferase [Candidatus Krumholzibacteria bacterium]
EIAMGTIMCLAVGDTVAGIVGKLFGRHKVKDKSMEGAAANFLVCFLILWFLVPSPLIAFVGAFAGAFIELVPVPVDDNIAIPLVSGFAMVLVGAL